MGVRQAVEERASQLWQEAPSNIAIDWPGPIQDDENDAEVERTIATAAHVARLTLTNQRLVVASMEPRGASASFDSATGTYTLQTTVTTLTWTSAALATGSYWYEVVTNIGTNWASAKSAATAQRTISSTVCS